MKLAMTQAWLTLAMSLLTAAVSRPAAAGPVPLSDECGTPTLPDRAAFDYFAARNNFPGAMQVPEVKFLITDVDTPAPQLYFMNSKNYPYHYDFAVVCLGQAVDLDTFNLETYFSDHRKYLAGSIIAHDYYEPNDAAPGIYTMEFWPTDPVTFPFVRLTYDLITANMPFARDRLFFHAPGETQRALYEAEKPLYDASAVAVIQTEDLFSRISYLPLTMAEAYGRLRVVQGPATVSARDVVVYRTLPNTLSHVAGVITEIPQTPLSHVNLKAKQNHTPNAYIKDAATRPDVLALAGKYVHFIVAPDGYTLEEASWEQVEAFFESLRPKEPRVPPRNLDVTAIAPLAALGFADSNSYGAKAANVAELAKVLPAGVVPDGFAVPFYFYDEFMKGNGFYEAAAALLAEPAFQEDPTVRENRLTAFRRTLRGGAMPDWMLETLATMHQSFPAGTALRCRSSTNNEDLPNFNGAGLYESYTHHPEEGHIAKTVKQVWASLWTYRAFEEREFHRVDHLHTAMGVLVHPHYAGEQANGVGVTKNIYDADWPGYYVNVQVGEDLVTNPSDTALPDEFLVADLLGAERYEIQYVRHSNLHAGGSILTKEQVFELADVMGVVQAYFRYLYGAHPSGPDFAMEIEFKITADGRLNIKQARPWVE